MLFAQMLEKCERKKDKFSRCGHRNLLANGHSEY